MGEIADMMLDGTMCQQCGDILIDPESEPQGFPGLCAACARAERAARKKTRKSKKKRRGSGARP